MRHCKKNVVEGGIVNEVFERLNRNSRKLTRQELRHAKYDGWLISHVESQAARELYASFLGSGTHYTVHAASKQSILGLVAAGFGVTLVTEAQAHVKVPGIVYRPIFEKNATIQVVLVWVRENENAVVGRFVSFMRQFARARVGVES